MVFLARYTRSRFGSMLGTTGYCIGRGAAGLFIGAERCRRGIGPIDLVTCAASVNVGPQPLDGAVRPALKVLASRCVTLRCQRSPIRLIAGRTGAIKPLCLLLFRRSRLSAIP